METERDDLDVQEVPSEKRGAPRGARKITLGRFIKKRMDTLPAHAKVVIDFDQDQNLGAVAILEKTFRPGKGGQIVEIGEIEKHVLFMLDADVPSHALLEWELKEPELLNLQSAFVNVPNEMAEPSFVISEVQKLGNVQGFSLGINWSWESKAPGRAKEGEEKENVVHNRVNLITFRMKDLKEN